jgi:hypothetical protein
MDSPKAPSQADKVINNKNKKRSEALEKKKLTAKKSIIASKLIRAIKKCFLLKINPIKTKPVRVNINNLEMALLFYNKILIL